MALGFDEVMANQRPIELGRAAEAGETTVLLVDDDQGVRRVLEHMVSLLGFRTCSAGNAEDALALAATQSVQLLVCDVTLPRLNGYELARRLTSDSPETRVLFISGYSGEALADRYGHVEDAPHLAKPFTFAALAAAIGDLVAAEQLAA
jgi:CheY-like chemotaxis protein